LDPTFLSPFFKFHKINSRKGGYPGRVRGLKNRLRGLFEHVRLGQDRKAIIRLNKVGAA
jgi:hypothetical protein